MEKVLDAVKGYLTQDELSLFIETYKEKYQEYKNKEIYKGYPLTEYLDNVLLRLAQFNVDTTSLYVALLVKSQYNNLEEISSKYGEETKIMLEALAKIDRVKEKTHNDIDNDNYRKIF